MNTAVRLKLIGEDPELDLIEKISRGARLTYSRHHDLDEACESHSTDPVEVFVLGLSFFFQSHINQIQKLPNRPEVILASGPRLPNLAKILVPHIIYSDWSENEIIWALSHAGDVYRRSRRLEALRDHHKRNWSLDGNPAIKLVTGLMKKCTAAEEYRDLLMSVLSLREVIDFHDASLLVVEGQDKVIEAWHSTKENKDRILDITKNIEPPDLSPDFFPEGEVKSFSSSGGSGLNWDSFTTHPWSFGLALRFSQGHSSRNQKTKKSAVLLFYRRELVPYVERDFWLFEMTYGPLALSLEKIVMLKTIGQASKEWRSTFDSISEPLTVIDSSYQIVKANKAFAQLVDQDIKKLKSKRCYALLANRRTPCVGCPLGMEAKPGGGSRVQLQGKNKKDLLVWSYGIRTGLDTYHFQFYRNVSKETVLASTLIQSEKMAALGRLVGAIAHEINNPLAGILATSQILLSDLNDSFLSEDVSDDLKEIHSAALRSKKIIEDLLGFTSTEERPKEMVSLLEVVNSTLVFSKAALRDAVVKVSSCEPIPRVLVSINSMQQVLFNLVTNAAQAMNGQGNLEIRLEEEIDSYRIHIKDSGPGIPSDKLKYIFDPFFTSKQEGTGLGLSIVKNLIQKMNARIEVSSSMGKGTEFIIFLPKASSTEAGD